MCVFKRARFGFSEAIGSRDATRRDATRRDAARRRQIIIARCASKRLRECHRVRATRAAVARRAQFASTVASQGHTIRNKPAYLMAILRTFASHAGGGGGGGGGGGRARGGGGAR